MNVYEMENVNVDSCINKMNRNFKNWSQRQLLILGKILICKCFGISQIIYLMQSMTLKNDHFKRINACLYKFIWNKHFSAAKAPERIARNIVNLPIKHGSLGMVSITDLDDSLKLRGLGRLPCKS